MLDARDVVVIVQPVYPGGSMPGRPAGQFVTFQQDNIRPTEFGQVIGDGAPNESSTYDDSLSMLIHNPVIVIVLKGIIVSVNRWCLKGWW